MEKKIDFSPKNIEALTKFLEQNKGVDFTTFDLSTENGIEKLNFKNLIKKKQSLLPLIKAYQRLLRIVPDREKNTALVLLEEGVHSALQITSMTRKDFVAKFLQPFGGNREFIEKIYHNALNKRSVLLIQYMNMLQNNEPHISAARFK